MHELAACPAVVGHASRDGRRAAQPITYMEAWMIRAEVVQRANQLHAGMHDLLAMGQGVRLAYDNPPTISPGKYSHSFLIRTLIGKLYLIAK
jgi:hypothetical protein